MRSNLARFIRRLTRKLQRGVARSLEELRDAWAITFAEVAAVLVYALGRSEIEAASVGAAVLAVRVGAGVALPGPPGPAPVPPPSPPIRVLQIRSHIDKGLTDREIARRMKVSERFVARVRREYVRPVPSPEGPAPHRHWYDEPIVRGTLAAASFLSLALAIYRVLEISGILRR